MTTALRTALIWHDEVMDDVVVQKSDKVTLSARRVRQLPPLWTLLIGVIWFVIRWRRSGVPTFIVPELGLPPMFAILRPGNHGYLLTLGKQMRGTICLGGEQKDVAAFVARGDDGGGGFRATAIGGRDWGVIELDESGHHKLFFQFVQVEDPPQFFTRPVLLAASAGYLISCMALTLLWYSQGVVVGEAAFRGIGIATVAILIGGVAWSLIRDDGESQASLAFSVILHGALLAMAFQLYQDEDPFVWPGPRALTGNYLVTRLDKEEPPEVKPTPTITGKPQAEAAATKEPPKHTATKGDEGRQGGEGDTERARDPNAKDVPPAPPKVQFFEDKNKKVLDNIINRNLATSLDKFTGIKGDKVTRGAIGFGPGKGSGVGAGQGTGTRSDSKKGGSGGGGNVEGDFVSGGKIDTGTNRPGGGNCKGPGCGTGPKPVQLAFAAPSGDFDQLTAEEIDRVVRARAGVFRACYQKELNHTPGIGGKLVIHFKIGGDGVVQPGNTQTSSGSTLRNDAVEQCVKGNVNRLKFPAKGGIANVNYPFVFTQGG